MSESGKILEGVRAWLPPVEPKKSNFFESLDRNAQIETRFDLPHFGEVPSFWARLKNAVSAFFREMRV